MKGGCCQVNAESQLIAGLAIVSQTILRTKVPLRKTLEPQFSSLKTMQPCLGEFSLLL